MRCVRSDLVPMPDRRGSVGSRDIGLRTRATDWPHSVFNPQLIQEWASTFRLRWAEHQRQRRTNQHDVA